MCVEPLAYPHEPGGDPSQPADVPEAVSSEDKLAKRILNNLGFCGHYMHFHGGGVSGKAPIICLLAKQPGGEMSQQELGMHFDLKPGSLSEILSKLELNGLIEREVGDYPANPGEFATEVRASAWRTWKTMERDENLPMGAWRTMGRQFLVDDAISTLMVTIIQIFGRLARLADKERPAPHVYFADAAFRGGDGKLSFRTLEELGAYMERLMHDSDQPEVAKALYGPFYESFRKGIGNVGL